MKPPGISSSVTLTLSIPITANGAQLSELQIRRPKVRDMIAMDKSTCSDAEKELALFANLCELDAATLHELDMLDYGKLQETYQSFLSLQPATPDVAA